MENRIYLNINGFGLGLNSSTFCNDNLSSRPFFFGITSVSNVFGFTAIFCSKIKSI